MVVGDIRLFGPHAAEKEARKDIRQTAGWPRRGQEQATFNGYRIEGGTTNVDQNDR